MACTCCVWVFFVWTHFACFLFSENSDDAGQGHKAASVPVMWSVVRTRALAPQNRQLLSRSCTKQLEPGLRLVLVLSQWLLFLVTFLVYFPDGFSANQTSSFAHTPRSPTILQIKSLLPHVCPPHATHFPSWFYHAASSWLSYNLICCTNCATLHLILWMMFFALSKEASCSFLFHSILYPSTFLDLLFPSRTLTVASIITTRYFSTNCWQNSSSNDQVPKHEK